MLSPERFDSLPDYAFPRLRRLLGDHPPGDRPIAMSIGEPRHEVPPWVAEIVAAHAHEFINYPPNEGTPELLQAISDWIGRRYAAPLPPNRIMALNGTREGLFNACLALCSAEKNGRPAVLLPNPFYQCYAAAALAAGAEPVYVPATAETGFLPDFASLPRDLLDRTAIAYLCSPANPQGAVADADAWTALLGLAERHGFHVFADECYSEIYEGAPPPGALEVAAGMGADPETVVAFNSLSKRSSLPGLRSGFVAAGPRAMARIRRLRAYAGAPLPTPLMRAAERLWADEAHVAASRARYATKYALARKAFASIPSWRAPRAGFFLWLPVDDAEAACLAAWRDAGVRTLPGTYLSRTTAGGDPGAGYIRAAMVAPEDEVALGLARLATHLHDHIRG